MPCVPDVKTLITGTGRSLEDAIRCKTTAPEVRTILTGDVEETSNKRKYRKIKSAWFVAWLIGWLVV